MGYALPTTTDWVTASWADHKNRTPPSSEPGTDYGSAYGSPLYAVEDGTVSYVKTTNSAATGRVVEYRLDDGRTTRSLHLAEIWVGYGQRVAKGQQIGRTGASGHGSDWGYSPHLHQTLWPGAAWAAPTIDFENYLDEPEEPDMSPEEHHMLQNVYDAIFVGGESMPDGGRALGQTVADIAGGKRPTVYRPGPDGSPHYIEWIQELADTKTQGIELLDRTDPQQEPTTTLTGPAWMIGAFLGLIGLVEVLRFIVDLIV